MKYLIPAIVAVVSLCAASAQACNPVAIVAPQQAFYAAPVVQQQVVYQPMVQAVQVQSVAYAPVVQQVAIGHHCRQQVRVQRQRIRVRPARVQQVNVQVY